MESSMTIVVVSRQLSILFFVFCLDENLWFLKISGFARSKQFVVRSPLTRTNCKMLNCYDNAMINAQQMAFLRCARSTPRRHFIDKPAEIAVFFANVVTTPSADDWVARNGEQSIFSAFRSVLPEVITYRLRF
jgi:hypothetical protein